MEPTPYFAELVRRELASARIKHERPIVTLFDGYGTIKEELDEFWDELKKRDRDKNAILIELVQVAAMCQRAAEDLGMVPPRPTAATLGPSAITLVGPSAL